MVELTPPPEYTPSDSQDGVTPSPTHHKRYPAPADIKPTNFLQVSRPGKIKGIWVINPTMVISGALLPPASLSARKNILLKSKAGGIDGDIFVMPSSGNLSGRKTTIEIQTGKESLYIRVHDAQPGYDASHRVPMHISCTNNDGEAHIYLPRSFRGPLRVESGTLNYTKAVKECTTSISEVNGEHCAFIGQFGASESWKEDELHVKATRPVKIYFDDEGEIPSKDLDGGCVCA